MEKNQKRRIKIQEYQICWHDLVVADSIRESLKIVRSILDDLEKLAKLEQEVKLALIVAITPPVSRQLRFLMSLLDQSL